MKTSAQLRSVADGRLDPRRYDSYCQITESPYDANRDEDEEL